MYKIQEQESDISTENIYADISLYIENNIDRDFHNKRLESLSSFQLNKLLKSKNFYLFKAKNISTAHDVVKILLDAYLSSQEETIFGDFLEKLAIFICDKVHGGGVKSDLEGIDLEFQKDSTYYVVQIKSGPHWGNSGQLRDLRKNFRKAKKFIKNTKNPKRIIAVNGCCYGKENKTMQGYAKLCGQKFWELISGDDKLYINIIEPLGHEAKKKNEKFYEIYSQIVNKFTAEFIENFCKEDGSINWEELVKLNSEFQKVKHTKRT